MTNVLLTLSPCVKCCTDLKRCILKQEICTECSCPPTINNPGVIIKYFEEQVMESTRQCFVQVAEAFGCGTAVVQFAQGNPTAS